MGSCSDWTISRTLQPSFMACCKYNVTISMLLIFCRSLGMHKSGKEGKDYDTSLLLSMRNGQGIGGSTVQSGTRSVACTHVAICGGMQPAVFEATMCKQKFVSNGMLGRFDVIVPPITRKTPGAVHAVLCTFNTFLAHRHQSYGLSTLFSTP